MRGSCFRLTGAAARCYRCSFKAVSLCVGTACAVAPFDRVPGVGLHARVDSSASETMDGRHERALTRLTTTVVCPSRASEGPSPVTSRQPARSRARRHSWKRWRSADGIRTRSWSGRVGTRGAGAARVACGRRAATRDCHPASPVPRDGLEPTLTAGPRSGFSAQRVLTAADGCRRTTR
jgi:hypothetical protein